MTTKEKVAIEALRHTELRLEDLEKYAAGADRRALAFSAALAALASATLAYSQSAYNPTACVLSAMALIACATAAVWTALPRSFHTRGHYWRDWKGHIDDNDSFFDVIASQASENDDRILENEAVLENSANNFRRTFYIAFWILMFNLGAQLGSV
jgi:hypothetical protein